MRVPLSWLREYVALPSHVDLPELERTLSGLGLEVESVQRLGAAVTGELVVGQVRQIEELTGYKKQIRYCQVDVGAVQSRGIVCGARNFAEGDLVVVALPGAVLPGGFAITARRTYERISDGMICSARELGLGDDHSGILVLAADQARPGDPARPLIGLDEAVLQLEITPDRGYCLSMRGIARELAQAYRVRFSDPGAAAAPGATAQPPYPVQVVDVHGCDRFAARLVRGVDPAATSPAWLRTRLIQAGMRPISLAVDITNYLMLELGQPMHAFDADRLTGPLLVRRAVAGERLTTLDGVDRALSPEDLVICDTGLANPIAGDASGAVISLAAVMGGATTEVGPQTTSVLLEAAHWDPVSVSRTARRHQLLSEASKRFERNVDPQLPLVALQRAVELLTRHGGGIEDGRVLDIDHVAAPVAVSLPADLPARVAGTGYPRREVIRLLQALGATVRRDGGHLQVTPPSWRPDLVEAADLCEEVIRLAGYDAVPGALPGAPAGSGLTATQRRRRSVARALAEAGYVEVLSYPFVAAASFDALRLAQDDPRRDAMRLANPLSDQAPLMRTTLLPPLLGVVKRNLGRGQRDLALYELGTVVHPRAAAGQPAPQLPVRHRPTDAELEAALALVPDQPWHVAAAYCGDRDPAGWWGPGRVADWSDAVQAARIVAEAAGVAIDIEAASQPPWHPGRCARIVAGGQLIGYAGELHPAVCAALELPKRTCAMELNLDALPLPEVTPAPRFWLYPPALIDVALVVERSVPAAAVTEALTDGAGPLLESVRLFDVYTSERLGARRRSLAYKLTFRAADRTLTIEEAVAARDRAVAEAGSRVGAVLRGTH